MWDIFLSFFRFNQIAECEELKETIVSLREQLADVVEQGNLIPLTGPLQGFSESGNLHMGYQIGRENSVPKDSNGTLVLQAQVPLFLFPSGLPWTMNYQLL